MTVRLGQDRQDQMGIFSSPTDFRCQFDGAGGSSVSITAGSSLLCSGADRTERTASGQRARAGLSMEPLTSHTSPRTLSWPRGHPFTFFLVTKQHTPAGWLVHQRSYGRLIGPGAVSLGGTHPSCKVPVTSMVELLMRCSAPLC